MSVYHVYARLTVYAPDQQALLYHARLQSGALVLVVAPHQGARSTDRVPWSDLALAALSLACVGYLFATTTTS